MGGMVEELGCVEGLGLVSGGVACFWGFLYLISFHFILFYFILFYYLLCSVFFYLIYFILFYVNLFCFQILLSLSPESGARLESHVARE